MNVWLLPSAFHPHRGGVEELTLQLARHLRDRGHQVRVITNRHPPDLPPADVVDGIRVQRIAFPSPRASARGVLRFPPAFSTSVASLVRGQDRPDVVHVQCASVQVAPAAIAANLHRAPLVMTTQGETRMDANRTFDHSVYFRTSLRWASRSSAGLTACSRWAADAAATVAGRFAAAVVIPNGINPTEWIVTRVPDEPVAVAWGRHVPQKGFDLLVAAWTDVRKSLPSARLLVGGEGPEAAALHSIAGEGVEFMGSLDRSGVQRLLDRSRVAVVPSRIEPFGIVALEAMATGRAVVWSARGGLHEATGGLGWSVDPTDRGALAATIVAALQAPAEPATYRRRAEQLSWASLTDRYLDLYADVTSRRRKPR
jgi:glycogen(starch) synthase